MTTPGTNGAGWFPASRHPDALELLASNHHALVLAYVIAQRANWRLGFNRHGLAFGEAMLGDHDSCKMSEREYRTAKATLAKWGFATFRATNKGTIGKLTDTRLFSINASMSDEQNDEQPTSRRRAGDEQPTGNLKLKSSENFKIGRTIKSDKASKPLTPVEKEIADDAERLLAVQWTNDAGKWIERIRRNPDKARRVLAELKNAIRERRVSTTPAQFAEDTWKRFALNHHNPNLIPACELEVIPEVRGHCLEACIDELKARGRRVIAMDVVCISSWRVTHAPMPAVRIGTASPINP